jgi:hypothetical protein
MGCDTGKGGTAGLITIPLLGGRPGHWLDLWPVVQTDSLAEYYRAFESQARDLQAVVVKETTQKAQDPNTDQRYFESLDKLLTSLLVADREDDDQRPVSGCSEPDTTSDTFMSNLASKTNDLLPCLQQIETNVASGKWTATVGVEHIAALWNEYELLENKPRRQRQIYLFGPAAGLPIWESNRNPNDLLWGLALEAGTATFRLMVAAGYRTDWDDPFCKPVGICRIGWWAGIGLSGQLADDLFNKVSGVPSAMSGIK